MWEKIKSFLFKNVSARQTVAKNTIWLSISQFGGRFIKAIIIIYAARVLGTSEYGIFSYAVTLAGFMSLLMDPGINSVLIRETAKTSDNQGRAIFSTILILKLLLIGVGVGIIVFLGPYFSILPGAKALLPIAALILVFDTFREFFISLFRGMEKMEWDAAIFLLTNVAIVIFGFTFMASSPTAKSLAWGYALGTALGAIAGAIALKDRIQGMFANFSSSLIKPLMKSAWPFAITGALGLLFTNTDILIISWFKTASDVGIYSAAIRIIQVLYLIPGVLQLSMLPLFSRLANLNNRKFREILEQSISLLFLASIPMAIGGIILGTQLMSFIFGANFAVGGLSFKLLMATLIIDFPGSIIANAIFAYSHQKSLIITSAIGGISNVMLDILLIPRFGMTGSAVATLVAQTISNGYLWYVMKKINYFEVLPRLHKIFGAGLIMSAGTLFFTYLNINVFANIVASGMLYFASLWLLHEPVLGKIVTLVKKPE